MPSAMALACQYHADQRKGGIMFGWLFKKRKKSKEEIEREQAEAEAFDKAKQEALERVLGPSDDTVLHSMIPFFLGGSLDLYFFRSCTDGTAVVTQELIVPEKNGRPKPGKAGYFELVACIPPGTDPHAKGALDLVEQVLNPVARFASMASLNPHETAELPGEDNEPTLPVLFDEFNPKVVPFTVGSETFHLLLVMTITHAELAFARANRSAALIEKLKAAGVYPHSIAGRQSVV